MITISNWWEGRIRTSSCTRTLLVPHLCFFGRSHFLPAGVVTGRRQGSAFNPVSTFSNGIGCQNSSCESRRPGYTSEIPRTMVNRGSLSIIVSCSSAGGIRIILGLTITITQNKFKCAKKIKNAQTQQEPVGFTLCAVEIQASQQLTKSWKYFTSECCAVPSLCSLSTCETNSQFTFLALTSAQDFN